MIYQKPKQTAKYIRVDVSSDAGNKMLDSYNKAVGIMLQLPPENPLNWYRLTLVHVLDCPHGNWWFLPWHRGYLGWFEKAVRKLSDNPDFALPFWDWTKQPYIPTAFFEERLTPTHPAYLESYELFKQQLEDPISNLWKSFSQKQRELLLLREYPNEKALWEKLPGMFFPRAHARTLTEDDPNLEPDTQVAVALSTINDALASRDFITFSSAKTPHHSVMSGFSILEGQPHNKVHNAIGGFMKEFLSPIDPIFYMHHSNIDRLWNIWEEKQTNAGLPIIPEGNDLELLSNEYFPFFYDENGQSVSNNRAGDYLDIGDFDYSYAKGSGEAELVEGTDSIIHAVLKQNTITRSENAYAQMVLPALSSLSSKPTLFAIIEIEPKSDIKDITFDVLLNTQNNEETMKKQDPYFVANLAFFGNMDMQDKPVTFMVPLTDTLQRVTNEKERLPTELTLSLRMCGESKATGNIKVKVNSVVLKGF